MKDESSFHSFFACPVEPLLGSENELTVYCHGLFLGYFSFKFLLEYS